MPKMRTMSDEKDFGMQCLREVNATPLPVDLFMEMVQISIEAKSGTRRVLPPDAERCTEDYPPGAMWLSDCPENQMGMSIVMECQKRFPDRKRAQDVSQS